MLTLLPVLSALAAPSGLVVRLDAHGENLSGTVVVKLTPKEGDAVEVTLADDGARPDVSAGDGAWTGAGTVEGTRFDVTMVTGGKTLSGGSVSWGESDNPRDLDLVMERGALKATASKPSQPTTGGTQLAPDALTPPNDAGTPATGEPPLGNGVTPGEGGTTQAGGAAGGTAGGAPGDAPGTATGKPPLGDGVTPGEGGAGGPAGAGPAGGAASVGPRPTGVSFPSGTSQDPTLFIALGVGLLLLVGVAWMWVRSRRGEGPGRPAGISVVAEPGLLGPGTPSLSDGLFLWVAEGDTDALLRPLLTSLAARHRVLFVARSRVNVPSVHGGPVYRMASHRPSHVGDVAEALVREGGAPLAVLIVGDGETEATLRDYADLLPAEVGGVAIVARDLEVPLTKLHSTEHAGGWMLRSGDATFHAQEGPAGLEVQAVRTEQAASGA